MNEEGRSYHTLEVPDNARPSFAGFYTDAAPSQFGVPSSQSIAEDYNPSRVLKFLGVPAERSDCSYQLPDCRYFSEREIHRESREGQDLIDQQARSEGTAMDSSSFQFGHTDHFVPSLQRAGADNAVAEYVVQAPAHREPTPCSECSSTSSSYATGLPEQSTAEEQCSQCVQTSFEHPGTQQSGSSMAQQQCPDFAAAEQQLRLSRGASNEQSCPEFIRFAGQQLCPDTGHASGEQCGKPFQNVLTPSELAVELAAMRSFVQAYKITSTEITCDTHTPVMSNAWLLDETLSSQFLSSLARNECGRKKPRTTTDVETVLCWYWIAQEMMLADMHISPMVARNCAMTAIMDRLKCKKQQFFCKQERRSPRNHASTHRGHSTLSAKWASSELRSVISTTINSRLARLYQRQLWPHEYCYPHKLRRWYE